MCIIRDDEGFTGRGPVGTGPIPFVGGNGDAPSGGAGTGSRGAAITGGGGLNPATQAFFGMGGANPATGAVSTTSGQAEKTRAPGVYNSKAYLNQYADVASYYAANSSNADFAKRFPTAEAFADTHYATSGQAEIAAGMRQPLASIDEPADPAATKGPTTEDLITNITKGFTTTIDGLRQSNTNLQNSINTSQTNFTTLVQGMQTEFAKNQTELMTQMQAASARQSEAMMKAIKDAQMQSGQKEKKPSYGKALDKNKQLNGSGLGSTAITGNGGVPVGSLTLGTTSLLGGK